MAYPTFKFSALGSNLNSGAGQGDDGSAAPLSGANANAPGGTTTITLTDASAGDMTAIVTDGTWAVKVNATQTYSIVGKNTGAKTITVDRNTVVLAGKTWKIGGPLLTFEGTRQLIETDWQANWSLSATNAQTLLATLAPIGCSGSLFSITGGLTGAFNGLFLYPNTSAAGPAATFDFGNSTQTCTHSNPAASSLIGSDGGALTVRNFNASGFYNFFAAQSSDDGMLVVENGTATIRQYGVLTQGHSLAMDGVRLRPYANTRTNGVDYAANANGSCQITNCDIDGFVNGIKVSSNGSTGYDRYYGPGFSILRNRIVNNSQDGILIDGDYGVNDNHILGSLIAYNTIDGNGGYGVDVFGSGWTSALLQKAQCRIRGVASNNAFGACNLSGVVGADVASDGNVRRFNRFRRF